MKLNIFFLLSFSFFTSTLLAQTNIIKLNVSQNDYQNYKAKNKKYIFKNANATVNDSGPIASSLSTRGQSCIGAPRRCFGIDLNMDAKLILESGEKWKTDGIILASMSQDTGYINNKIGFAFTKRMGLPTVKNTYSEVLINGQSLGLYLAQQKPHKLAKKAKSGFVGRRREEGNLEIKKFYPEEAKFSQIQYQEAFDGMYQAIKKYPESPNLYRYLNSKMNLNKYFKLLTLQSMLRNGDYTDELYFYAVANSSGIYFDIIPWDFEDLFNNPHPTKANKKALKKGWFNETILYSFEDPLDSAIFKNQQLHKAFKDTAKAYLENVLTEKMIDQSLDEVRSSITPYLDNNEIFRLSTLDESSRGTAYSKYGILNLLEQRRMEIKSRRKELLSKL